MKETKNIDKKEKTIPTENFSMEELLKLEKEYEKKKKIYDEKVKNLENKISKLKQELDPQENKNNEARDKIEKKQNKLLIESLSEKEKEIVEEEMKESTPEDFEAEEVKTGTGTFLCNEVVKSTSPKEFKIPEKIKSIIEKVKNKTLIGVAILSFLIDTGNIKGTDGNVVDYLNLKKQNKILSMDNKQMIEKIPGSIIKNLDLQTYNQFSTNAKLIYLYSLANEDSSFIIVDKPKAEMFVVGKDKKLIVKFPILCGKVKGEQPNKANPDTDTPGLYATTPAGVYRIGRDSVSEDGLKTYKGKIFSIYNAGNLAIHITYPGELKKRTKALNTPDIEDNRLSWGCINLDEENFDKYITGNISENAVLFITPDDENIILDPSTGKLGTESKTELLAKLNSLKILSTKI